MRAKKTVPKRAKAADFTAQEAMDDVMSEEEILQDILDDIPHATISGKSTARALRKAAALLRRANALLQSVKAR
jgi:hypothetical protein